MFCIEVFCIEVFDELLNKRCKVVYKDDERVKVVIGKLKSFSDNFLLITLDSNELVAVNASEVIKISTEEASKL